MVLRILHREIDLGSFLIVAARCIILAIFHPGCYVVNNDDSCSRLPSDIDRLSGLLFPGILVLVLLSMVIDYFNDCTRTHNLGIAS
jgi:hypothetical protein